MIWMHPYPCVNFWNECDDTITSNYRQTSRQMSIIVSIIVEVSMNKIALWIHMGVDDWTAERAIIANS